MGWAGDENGGDAANIRNSGDILVSDPFHLLWGQIAAVDPDVISQTGGVESSAGRPGDWPIWKRAGVVAESVTNYSVDAQHRCGRVLATLVEGHLSRSIEGHCDEGPDLLLWNERASTPTDK